MSCATLSTSAVFAFPDATVCSVANLNNNTEINLQAPNSEDFFIEASDLGQSFPNPNPQTLNFGFTFCATPSAPDNDDTTCEGPDPITAGSTFFITLIDPVTQTRCSYNVNISGGTIGATQFIQIQPPINNNPTSVPIFSPFGVAAMMGGLLWFGRRQKRLKTV